MVVKTLEETEYPQYYHKRAPTHDEPVPEGVKGSGGAPVPEAVRKAAETEDTDRSTRGAIKVFSENQKESPTQSFSGPAQGRGEHRDHRSYIRMFHQVRNLMEFVEMIAVSKGAGRGRGAPHHCLR